ncbi:hypothetical protein ACU635_60040 [[Actinomadura] parvosata]
MAWRLRLTSLLQDEPAAEAELRELVATFGASAPAPETEVVELTLTNA